MKCFPLLFLLLFTITTHPSHAQMAVYDSANQTTALLNHAENLSKWTEQIHKATEQVNKLNDLIGQMNDVEALIGKGMESIGIDPSITSAIDLSKAAMNFGSAMQTLQHTGGNTSFDLDKLRQVATDPHSWERYVTTSQSYERTQSAQKTYDEQRARLDQERKKAEAQLKAARSLGETAKAQAALDALHAADQALAEERKRAFEQQQANHIENQNQKEAWEQASRDWCAREAATMGKTIEHLSKGVLDQ